MGQHLRNTWVSSTESSSKGFKRDEIDRNRNVSLDKVAKLIGDSIKTTEKYHTGFIVSDNEVDIVKKVIGQV